LLLKAARFASGRAKLTYLLLVVVVVVVEVEVEVAVCVNTPWLGRGSPWVKDMAWESHAATHLAT
jgi:hypothetical protein